MIVDTSKLDYAFILRRYDAEADTGDMPQAVADNMLPVIRAQKRHRDEWRSLSGGV